MTKLAWLGRILSREGVLTGRTGLRPLSAGALLTSAAIVAAALGLRLALGGAIAGAQFITFFPAVIVATLFFGTGAGICAVVLSAVAAKFVMDTEDLTSAEWLSLMMFVAIAALDVVVISALLAANAKLQDSVGKIARLNASLRAGEAKFRDLLESAPDAIVIADQGERITLVNAEAERLFGYSRDELLGRSLELLMPVEHRAGHVGKMAAFIANPANRHMGSGRGLRALRKDGSTFPIETNLGLLTGGDEGPHVSSVVRDISDRCAAEERQVLLIHELNHRVKNTLATVQSIAAQTLRTTPDPAAFNAAILARLSALAQSHDLLTRNDWTGARLSDLVTEQLRAYETGAPNRIRFSGPDLVLSPKIALALGMALSELATNAAKYGALSVKDGEVSVEWSLIGETPPMLRLVWREHGGPRVRGLFRSGFGTRLIERGLAHELGGTARLDFQTLGVVCEIAFPLADRPGVAQNA